MANIAIYKTFGIQLYIEHLDNYSVQFTIVMLSFGKLLLQLKESFVKHHTPLIYLNCDLVLSDT